MAKLRIPDPDPDPDEDEGGCRAGFSLRGSRSSGSDAGLLPEWRFLQLGKPG